MTLPTLPAIIDRDWDFPFPPALQVCLTSLALIMTNFLIVVVKQLIFTALPIVKARAN